MPLPQPLHLLCGHTGEGCYARIRDPQSLGPTQHRLTESLPAEVLLARDDV